METNKSIDPHFQFVTADGSLMKRPDGSTMEFRPSAYVAFIQGDDFVLARDCRAGKLQFLGGGVNIQFDNESRALHYEMPDIAAEREAHEEAGIQTDHDKFSFVGQFSMFEPTFFYLGLHWSLPHGKFVLQPGEVREIVRVPYDEIRSPAGRASWKDEFYPAQWTMFGWLMCHIYYRKEPVFMPWRGEGSDSWAKFDSHANK